MKVLDLSRSWIYCVTLVTLSFGCKKQAPHPASLAKPASSNSSQEDASNFASQLEVQSYLGSNSQSIELSYCFQNKCGFKIEVASQEHVTTIPDGAYHFSVRTCERKSKDSCDDWTKVTPQAIKTTSQSTPANLQPGSIVSLAAAGVVGSAALVALGGGAYLVLHEKKQLQTFAKISTEEMQNLNAAFSKYKAEGEAKGLFGPPETAPVNSPKALIVLDLDKTIGAGNYEGTPGQPPLKKGARELLWHAIQNGQRIGIASANTHDIRAHLMFELGLDQKNPQHIALFDRHIKVAQPQMRPQLRHINNFREIYKTSKGEMVAKLLEEFQKEGFDPKAIFFADDKYDYHNQVLSHPDLKNKKIPVIALKVGDNSSKDALDKTDYANRHHQFLQLISSKPDLLQTMIDQVGEERNYRQLFSHDQIKNFLAKAGLEGNNQEFFGKDFNDIKKNFPEILNRFYLRQMEAVLENPKGDANQRMKNAFQAQFIQKKFLDAPQIPEDLPRIRALLP